MEEEEERDKLDVKYDILQRTIHEITVLKKCCKARLTLGDEEAFQEMKERLREVLHVTVSFAQSLDGSIARVPGQRTTISCHETMRMTHALRSIHDAILVGVGTVIADDCSLTTRLVQGSNPQPVILDSRLRIPIDCKLIRNSQSISPWIFASSLRHEHDKNALSEFNQRKHLLESAGAIVFDAPLRVNDKQTMEKASSAEGVDLRFVLFTLACKGIQSVMIEGGAAVLHSVLSDEDYLKCLNGAIVTVSPQFIGGLSYVKTQVPVKAGENWKLNKVCTIDKDVVLDMVPCTTD